MFTLTITYFDNYGCYEDGVITLTQSSNNYNELLELAESQDSQDANGTYDYSIKSN